MWPCRLCLYVLVCSVMQYAGMEFCRTAGCFCLCIKLAATHDSAQCTAPPVGLNHLVGTLPACWPNYRGRELAKSLQDARFQYHVGVPSLFLCFCVHAELIWYGNITQDLPSTARCIARECITKCVCGSHHSSMSAAFTTVAVTSLLTDGVSRGRLQKIPCGVIVAPLPCNRG